MRTYTIEIVICWDFTILPCNIQLLHWTHARFSITLYDDAKEGYRYSSSDNTGFYFTAYEYLYRFGTSAT